jgi:hypothetical protein
MEQYYCDTYQGGGKDIFLISVYSQLCSNIRNALCADAQLYIVTAEKLIWNFVNLSMQDI